MNPTWVIAKRELGAYFGSLIAYLLLIVFLVLTGLFTWLVLSDVFFNQQVSLSNFFWVSQIVLLLFIPAITMGQFAEEKRTGTIELLLTKNVTNRQVVIGKFLACLLIVLVALAFTLPYYFSVSLLGNIDHGTTICGYLGLILLSASYISIGLFASSISNDQIVAFLLAIFLCLILGFLPWLVAQFFTGMVGDLMNMVSLTDHFNSISRGVIETNDLVYFFSIIALGLLLSEWQISNR